MSGNKFFAMPDYEQIKRGLESYRQSRLPVLRRHPRFYEPEIKYGVDDPQHSQFILDDELADLVHEFGHTSISVAISSAFNLAWPVIVTCHENLEVEHDGFYYIEALADLEPDLDKWPWNGEGPTQGLRDDAFFGSSDIGYDTVYDSLCAHNSLAASHAFSAIYLWLNGERAEEIAYQLRTMAYELASSVGLWNWYYMEDTSLPVATWSDVFIARWHNEVLTRLAVQPN